MGKIIINGKEVIVDGILQYKNGDWYVDGRRINLEDLEKSGEMKVQGNNCSCDKSKDEKTITVEGNLDELSISGSCKVVVNGNIGDLTILSGVVTVEGNVGGDVNVTGGSVTCGEIGGDLSVVGGVVNRR
jgi:hypothetical protein